MTTPPTGVPVSDVQHQADANWLLAIAMHHAQAADEPAMAAYKLGMVTAEMWKDGVSPADQVKTLVNILSDGMNHGNWPWTPPTTKYSAKLTPIMEVRSAIEKAIHEAVRNNDIFTARQLGDLRDNLPTGKAPRKAPSSPLRTKDGVKFSSAWVREVEEKYNVLNIEQQPDRELPAWPDDLACQLKTCRAVRHMQDLEATGSDEDALVVCKEHLAKP